MVDEPRPFLIPVRRRWTLWILPVLALLYFIAVLAIVSLNVEIDGVENELLALAGVAFFVLVALVELPFFLRRRRPRVKRVREPEPDDVPMAEALDAPLGRSDELRFTGETQQGLQVVEYSRPAKSEHRNAVFTKTYVPVTGAHVLRVETLVADASDL